MISVHQMIEALPLKEMDSTLLYLSISQKGFKIADPHSRGMEIIEALNLAAYLHRNQTRANRGKMPRTHYIEHPYRNAERLLRYGVTNVDLIVAAILHDTVEDCWEELTLLALDNGFTGDRAAVDYLYSKFSTRSIELVIAVTNPMYPAGLSKAGKREVYIYNVKGEVVDPEAWLLKFVDWVDNAVGLFHNVGPDNAAMVLHLVLKYSPLEQIFRDNLTPDVKALVSADGLAQIHAHLDSGHHSLALLKESYE